MDKKQETKIIRLDNRDPVNGSSFGLSLVGFWVIGFVNFIKFVYLVPLNHIVVIQNNFGKLATILFEIYVIILDRS